MTRKKISQWLLRLFGWHVQLEVPVVPKCVICVAPHTSNWDFIFCQLAYTSVGGKAGFFMKKEWFFFPFGIIFRSMGGVPIDRNKKGSTVEIMAKEFDKHEQFQIAITPEGTREKNPDWKKGFYYIALMAKVPIALAYIDFAKKEVGIKELFTPTGDEAKDMVHIKQYYAHVTAKHPERFTTGL